MVTLRDTLSYEPAELKFGTSGLRALVTDMTDVECYINTLGFLQYMEQIGHVKPGGAVYIAGDLRNSTPRVLKAVVAAVRQKGFEPVHCGFVPTPCIANYALIKNAPCIMVTGSHIPDDRNGIKFHRADGEVLKSDEEHIKEAVAVVRNALYGQDAKSTSFDAQGMFTIEVPMPQPSDAAADAYLERYTNVFGPDTFKGKKIVFYQHSAVGRDLLVTMLERMGAEVVPVGRSEKFISIDTENVTPADQAYFKQLSEEYPDAFAIVSTDGDSDRPFLIDEHGMFNRGDVLGAIVAEWLNADAVAYPVSTSDAVDTYLQPKEVSVTRTRIGSPFVISAMQEAAKAGHGRIVGWEVNGGFLTGVDFEVNGAVLSALPTRDAIFPIIAAMHACVQAGVSVSQKFALLPQRFTQAGIIDNFPTEVSQRIVAHFSQDTPEVKAEIASFFSPDKGFGGVVKLNTLDGVQIFFANGDVAHLRPSGNAPQLRCYSTANTQERADSIVAMAIAEPDGIYRHIEKTLQ